MNGRGTTDTYTDANTVIFTLPRRTFQLQVSNNVIFYQLAIPGSSGNSGDYIWESLEHQLVPSLTTFDETDAADLGVQRLSGIRVRSAQPTASAVCSVI